MNYKGHTFIGILSLFILIPFLNLFTDVAIYTSSFIGIIFFTILGALIPDIDSPHANISSVVQGFLLFIGIIYIVIKVLFFQNKFELDSIVLLTIVFPLASLFFTNFIDSVFGHRTITHSLLMFLIILIIGILLSINKAINPTYFSCFTWGYLTHIYSDGTTKMGVAYLYPFKKTFYHSLSTEKNGAEETLSQSILMLILLLFFIISSIYFFASDFTFFNLKNTPYYLKEMLITVQDFVTSFFNL